MNFVTSRRILLAFIAGAFWSFAPLAFADTNISTVPTSWRLQSYGGSTILWFTGSTCTYGKLELNSSWSSDQSKLLWATIMAAKASRLPVFISYIVDSSGSCVITSFALDPQ